VSFSRSSTEQATPAYRLPLTFTDDSAALPTRRYPNPTTAAQSRTPSPSRHDTPEPKHGGTQGPHHPPDTTAPEPDHGTAFDDPTALATHQFPNSTTAAHPTASPIIPRVNQVPVEISCHSTHFRFCLHPCTDLRILLYRCRAGMQAVDQRGLKSLGCFQPREVMACQMSYQLSDLKLVLVRSRRVDKSVRCANPCGATWSTSHKSPLQFVAWHCSSARLDSVRLFAHWGSAELLLSWSFRGQLRVRIYSFEGTLNNGLQWSPSLSTAGRVLQRTYDPKHWPGCS
jgi:hypothetical protein